ncbi:MAG TPA: hypothetical protein VK158_03590 [Acidobacteriota bacterium]|nr:hypothetical protein [Acidobacteriota bacterium]
MRTIASTYFAIGLAAFLIFGVFYLSHSPPAAQFSVSFEKSLACSADTDCAVQLTSCDICSCGTAINKNKSIELWCLHRSADCSNTCENTVPKCVNKMCTLTPAPIINDELYCKTDSDCTQQASCGCECPRPINTQNVVYLRCAQPQCDVYCPATTPTCVNNKCTLQSTIS